MYLVIANHSFAKPILMSFIYTICIHNKTDTLAIPLEQIMKNDLRINSEMITVTLSLMQYPLVHNPKQRDN